MKDAQQLDQANANMAKVKRLSKITHVLFLPLIIGAVLFAISTMIKPSRSASKLMGEELAKYQQEVEVLKSKVKQVEDLQSKPVGDLPEDSTINEAFENFNTRISRIEELLQGDPVRSLSVPLLRRDVDNISLRITEYQVAVREDFSQFYNVFMWAFGMLITVILSAFAYFQRKLDAESPANSKK